MIGGFRLLGVTALLLGCDNSANGDGGMPDKIRVALGMQVDEFNAQSALTVRARRLDPRAPGVLTIGEPHELDVEVNGRTVIFEAGGELASTYVRNGYYVPRPDSDSARIGSINFSMARAPVTLREAVSIANTKCEEMRASGLSSRHPDRFGLVNEAIGTTTDRPVTTPDQLIADFADRDIRAITAVLCDLEDNAHTFQIEIINFRRYNLRSRGGGEESDVFGERSYSVRGDVSQNLDAAREHME